MIVLLFSAATAYRAFISKNQLSALVNQFTDALEYARDTAITAHTTVTLCAKGNNDHCGFHWQNGQLILNEKTQHVLRVLSAMPNQYQLLWRSTLGDSDALRWRSDGFTRGQQGSFYICGKKLSAQIIVLRTGRLRVVTGEIVGCK